MATFSAILIPSGTGVTATVAATTATSGIKLSTYAKVSINASADVEIVFYSSKTATPPIPSATVGFRIPANSTFTFDLGSSLDTFALFNTAAAVTTYSYQIESVTS